jgi:flagellar basal-body rod protein FlgF
MDSAIFVGMSGAKEAMRSIQMISNNLANSNTTAFKADYETIKSITTNQHRLQTRVYSASDKTYSDFKPGPIINTGNDLDIAVSGRGFIAVQSKDGREGYTRAGNLQINKEGLLVTGKGDLVLGAKGVINVPPATRVHIGERGMVSAQLRGENERELADLGMIKLVDVPPNLLAKGEDGLFYLPENGTALHSESVKIVSGALEGSNVDPVRSLTELIDTSRKFEMHTKLIKSIEDNTNRSNQLLNITE